MLGVLFVSISVLRVEDDDSGASGTTKDKKFQSTSSVWRTTCTGCADVLHRRISIHVLRVEDDASVWIICMQPANFNPRPPCGGRRLDLLQQVQQLAISIHVLRVEDDASVAHLAFTVSNFNPRPPCGGRLLYGIAWASQRQFQSTSSVWRTTKCRCFSSKSQKISIHVLRVEDDRGESDGRRPARDFNPRPPCGGRLFVTGFIVITQIFQSTSSVWRTTHWIAEF